MVARTHGLSGTRVYAVWRQMMYRCYRESCPGWPFYGGRGVRVDPRWHDVVNFVADMGHPPSGLWLERIDNEAGYSRDNCRWASPAEQARNRRDTRLSPDIVIWIRQQKASGATMRALAGQLGVAPNTVSEAASGARWKDIR
jgi:hypothetical protein